MIREMMIGTALVGGGGYYAMSSYSAAEIRTVNATPADTWRVFDAMGDYWEGMIDLHNGGYAGESGNGAESFKPVITSVPGKEVDFRLMRQGVEAARIHATFEPLGDGKQTRMTLAVTANPEALGDKERGGITATLFKRGVAEMADQLIPEIESGRMLKLAETMSEFRRRMMANPGYGEAKMRREEYQRREAMNKAAQPGLDPNAAALNPQGAAVVPLNPNPRN